VHHVRKQRVNGPGGVIYSRMKTSYYSVMPSAVGPLTLRWSGDALAGVYFDNAASALRAPRGEWVRDDACLAPVRAQLEEYFRGERMSFDLPLQFEGTPFQTRVWRALRDIPFGQTMSYGALARRIGKINGSRAVGAANGQNPIAVIVPCHRVIGADGSLTGFGGGLPRKRWLLAHEGRRDPGETEAQTSLL
jgi:methylated-DNA-[protein]-cysteine S-methyltransferase